MGTCILIGLILHNKVSVSLMPQIFNAKYLHLFLKVVVPFINNLLTQLALIEVITCLKSTIFTPSVFVIVSLHQEVPEKLYKAERNAVESVSFERLKYAHQSAQKLYTNFTMY